MESIAWLETYLLNYPGAVFIVSHDRYFLDKVVTKVIEIDAGQVRMYAGNYSAYAEKKAQLVMPSTRHISTSSARSSIRKPLSSS